MENKTPDFIAGVFPPKIEFKHEVDFIAGIFPPEQRCVYVDGSSGSGISTNIRGYASKTKLQPQPSDFGLSSLKISQATRNTDLNRKIRRYAELYNKANADEHSSGVQDSDNV